MGSKLRNCYWLLGLMFLRGWPVEPLGLHDERTLSAYVVAFASAPALYIPMKVDWVFSRADFSSGRYSSGWALRTSTIKNFGLLSRQKDLRT